MQMTDQEFRAQVDQIRDDLIDVVDGMASTSCLEALFSAMFTVMAIQIEQSVEPEEQSAYALRVVRALGAAFASAELLDEAQPENN